MAREGVGTLLGAGESSIVLTVAAQLWTGQ